MDETAGRPGLSASDSADFRVSGHVHQLLNLAAALVRSSASATATAGAGSTASAAASAGVGTVQDSGGGESSGGGLPFGVDVGVLSDRECVRWAQDLEHLVRVGQALAVQVVAELVSRTEAGRYVSTGVRGPVDLLVQSLKVSAAEAHRRIRLAEAVLPVLDVFSGDIAPVRQPGLGEVFFRGEVSQEQGLLVAGFVDEAARLAENGRIDQECLAEVQSVLVEAGLGEGPDCLRRIGNRIMSHLDPDGQKPSHSDLVAKQGLFFRKPRRGLIHLDGYMTIAQHEQLMAAIGHATNPNHHTDVDTINTTTTGSHETTGTAQTTGTTQTAGTAGKAGTADECGSAGDGAGSSGGQDSLFEQLHGLMGMLNTTTTAAGQRDTAAQDRGRQTGPRGQAGREEALGASGSGWVAQPGPDSERASGPDPGPGSGAGPGDPGGEASGGEPGCGAEPGGGEPGWGSVWGEVPGQDDEPGQERRARVVGGVRIPWPGSAEMLEGLDPIDPASTDPVVKDDRTYAQKLLDGLLECVKLAARTEKLPLNGGLKAQLIIMTRQEDLARRDGAGTAFTAYNGPVPLGLFDQPLCDPEITNLLMGQGQEILNVGRTQRLFTPAQRKILFARDLGCCFPDCTIPAPWAEAHHVLPWQEGGESNISNAALLCGRHHTLIHHSEWTLALVQGTPCFTAPYLIDPTQTPRRNTYHHGLSKNSPNTQN